ncbi:MAG: glycosyltransferase family 4 protein [Bacteroidetes bacterium]|nr:MAG: glycosyltransferase family 4 protein [Bacteroidota bacterium]
MQIFFIPSWYPSPNSPLTGIFFRDQADAITALYPEHNVGVSTWGQNDERLLLWAKEPLKSWRKIWRKPAPCITEHRENWLEFFSPTHTWTRRVWAGNMRQIIRANEQNLLQFQVRKGKVSVIHAHVGFPAGHIARILSQKYNIPYCTTEQMSPFPFPYFLQAGKLMPALQLAYQHAQTNWAISQSLLADMQAQGVPRLAYLPNLIDETFFTPQEPRYEHFTFYFLGRMVEQKGVSVLLKAIAQVVKEFPRVHFRLGGEGEEKLAYQRLATELKIEPHLTWLGEQSRQEARREFQDCHAFVLPSLHETMGVVLAEALACGKPLVSTYCGGAESVVTPENGVLAQVGKAEDLAEKMMYVLQNYTQYKPETLRQDALTRFSRKVVVDKLLAGYEGAVCA